MNMPTLVVVFILAGIVVGFLGYILLTLHHIAFLLGEIVRYTDGLRSERLEAKASRHRKSAERQMKAMLQSFQPMNGENHESHYQRPGSPGGDAQQPQ